MKSPDVSCDHTCPRDCELLNEAIRRENEIAAFYDNLSNQCHYPDIQRFLTELSVEKRHSAQKISEAVNRMCTSFDPAGC